MSADESIMLVYSEKDRAVVSYDLHTMKIIDISRAPRRKDEAGVLYAPPAEPRRRSLAPIILDAMLIGTLAIVAWIPVWVVIMMVRR